MAYLARILVAVAAVALFVSLSSIAPALAQQPSRVNPQASAVTEDKLLQEAERIKGRGTLPDAKSNVIMQPAGREWREFHEVTLRWIGAVALLGTIAALVSFYIWRGMIRIESGRSGRTIVRFNIVERTVHWVTAACFIMLAISGLNITFGTTLLLPLIGPEAFSAWSNWARNAHHYLSFPFTLGVVLIFLMWIAGNIPNRVDLEWFKRGGGMIGNDHPPAYRFNGGQKMIYWIVVLGGAAVAVSGYVLMFPFYGTSIEGMQNAAIVHGIIAALFIAAMLGHIYIGTIGMEGAFEAMGSGRVDANWAKQHHRLWLDEENARIGPYQSQQPPPATRATPATPAE